MATPLKNSCEYLRAVWDRSLAYQVV